MADAEPQAKKKSDLGVRAASAAVMLVVAGTALWLGGTIWSIFVLAIAAGVMWEWARLALRMTQSPGMRIVWIAGGIVYITFAARMLTYVRSLEPDGLVGTLVIMAAVIAVDIGAYFAGRTIGGPKIAPRISPSKTWAGLGGGIVGATVVIALYQAQSTSTIYGCLPGATRSGYSGLACANSWSTILLPALVAGSIIAVVAQAGDFFESWMKRRAGVKDSSALIPGHGGLFDRVDGLLAVLFVAGIVNGWDML